LNQYTREYLGILLPGWIFFLAPVLLWIVGFVGIGKNNFDPQKSVLLFTLSVPVMNLLPTVSHDYKLVLLSSPFLILLFTYLIKLEHAPSRFAAIQEVLKIILLMLLMFVIGRTYVYTHPILKNKYPLILFLQLLTILEIYLQRAFWRGPDDRRGISFCFHIWTNHTELKS
jgi:FlaA1/EpsC-like NDP-sugar epimerase